MNQHYSWEINPATGDWKIENGDPVPSTNLDVPIFIRLRAARKQWLYAPDTQYGSDYYLARKHNTTTRASAALNIASAALKPLVDEGRALTIDFENTSMTRFSETLLITYRDKSGRENELQLTGIY